ncbi:MAG: hypothetical protein AOA65_0219 [Candidatus Bathyarchaeota archaeon BA1]|nr:MAG: hypothetical protein AOA65_0219 [Candidatus Bathyarchaeota archaeon BA1]
MSDKVVTTVRIDKELWDQFIDKVYRTNGKTHGGVIRRTIEEIVRRYVESETWEVRVS